MPTLFQWNLVLRHGIPLGVGIVSEHPRLLEGTYIHTSPIFHAVRTENDLQLETASGSIYHLQMEEWSPSASETELLHPDVLGLPPDFWTQCVQVREDSSRKTASDLQSSYKPGTLFIRTVGTYILSAFWIDTNAQGQGIPVMEHQGMFQDSYIITNVYQTHSQPRQVNLRFFQDSYIITNTHQNGSEPSQVDLRLFPKWNRLEPYHVSQSLETLLVRNEGHTDITVGFPENKILCTAGAVTTIPIQNFLNGENT